MQTEGSRLPPLGDGCNACILQCRHYQTRSDGHTVTALSNCHSHRRRGSQAAQAVEAPSAGRKARRVFAERRLQTHHRP